MFADPRWGRPFGGTDHDTAGALSTDEPDGPSPAAAQPRWAS
jgi:hypothetical protein